MRRFRWTGRGSRAATTSSDVPADRGPEDLAPIPGLLDPEVAGALARDGFARLGPFLDGDEIARGNEIFDAALEQLDRPVGDTWFPTILLPEDDVRAQITSGLEDLVLPGLWQVFDRSSMELMRLDYSVKPASPNSALGPHQDFSVIDEEFFTSLYIWVPLSDSNLTNGTLHVVPGSHRFSNRIRSRHVPAVFDEVLDEVHESAIRLDCRAGELIVMVSGVIHFSPPNLSDDLRLAVHGIVKPAAAPLVFFYADEETPEGRVECYEMDIEKYVRCIHEGRPSGDVEMDRLVPRPPRSMDPERFGAGAARFLHA
ncbi:MAG: phytanoyl-CoA dioxygenase family protein [Propionicimonas sp.]